MPWNDFIGNFIIYSQLSCSIEKKVTHTRGAHDLISECIQFCCCPCIANSMDMTTMSIAIWITLYFYQRRRRHWTEFFLITILHKIEIHTQKYPCWSSSSIVIFNMLSVCCIFMNEWKSRRMTSEERKIIGYFWPNAASHETRTL